MKLRLHSGKTVCKTADRNTKDIDDIERVLEMPTCRMGSKKLQIALKDTWYQAPARILRCQHRCLLEAFSNTFRAVILLPIHSLLQSLAVGTHKVQDRPSRMVFMAGDSVRLSAPKMQSLHLN